MKKLEKQIILQRSIIDVSGIIEKFNVCVTLAIIPRMKNINKVCDWFISSSKHRSFSLLGSLLGELGFSTISHLFRKRLIVIWNEI